MSVVRESGEVGSAEQRYWRRTGAVQAWWPWGIVRVLILMTLYIIGAAVTAPQVHTDARRLVLDWLEVSIGLPDVGKNVETAAIVPANANSASFA